MGVKEYGLSAKVESSLPGSAQILGPGAKVADQAFVDQNGVERRLSELW